MLTAKTSGGKLISLMKYTKEKIAKLREQEQFFCPDCGERVIVRVGPKTIPHFAHERHSSCENNHGGESDYHEAGKLALYRWLQQQRIDCEVEKYIATTKQRADVFATVGKRPYTFEFQCTKISLKQIEARHARYLKTESTPVWLLSERMLRMYTSTTLHVNSFILSFLHFFKHHNGTSLYFLCPHKKRLTIVQNIMLLSQRRAIAHIRVYPLQSLQFAMLFSEKNVTNEQLTINWLRAKRHFRLARANYTGKELSFRKWLYERRFFVETLPSVIYMPSHWNVVFSVSPWIWQSVCVIHLLDRLPIGAHFTISHAYELVKRYVYKSSSRKQLFHHFAIVALQSYFELLVQEKLVRKVGVRTYEKIADVPRYRNVEAALRGDAEVLKRFMYNHNERDV